MCWKEREARSNARWRASSFRCAPNTQYCRTGVDDDDTHDEDGDGDNNSIAKSHQRQHRPSPPPHPPQVCMAREYEPEMGVLRSALARWWSCRQMQRNMIVVFVVCTIFVLDRYRVALAGNLGIAETQRGTQQEVETVDDGSAEMEASIFNAGNGTLGFHKIYYINMRARHDREDAMALQSYISGIETTDFPPLRLT